MASTTRKEITSHTRYDATAPSPSLKQRKEILPEKFSITQDSSQKPASDLLAGVKAPGLVRFLLEKRSNLLNYVVLRLLGKLRKHRQRQNLTC